MNIFTDKPIELSDHMLSTYQTLRVVLVVIALALPLLLWIGGYISADRLTLQRSISAYYHANAASLREHAERQAAKSEGRQYNSVHLDSGRGVMRNWFVGALFAISVLLAAYKGFRPAEDRALNLAALLALLVAVFPSEWNNQGGGRLHIIFAVSFFLCIAYVCIFCASATLSLVRENKRAARYRRLYKMLGWMMVISPVAAVIWSQFVGRGYSTVFYVEAFAVYAFAAYWLVKTMEIRETKADRKAATGQLQLEAGAGASDAVRELEVEPTGRLQVSEPVGEPATV